MSTEVDLSDDAVEKAVAIIGYVGCNCPAETRNDPAMICKWCLLQELLSEVKREADSALTDLAKTAGEERLVLAERCDRAEAENIALRARVAALEGALEKDGITAAEHALSAAEQTLASTDNYYEHYKQERDAAKERLARLRALLRPAAGKSCPCGVSDIGAPVEHQPGCAARREVEIDPTWCGDDGCKGYPDCRFMRECQGDKARAILRPAAGKSG